VNTAELRRRERFEEEAVPVREPEARELTPAESLLCMQRSAGNAAVARRLGAAQGARGDAGASTVPAADRALARMLAGTASQRAGVKERDPAAEAEATTPEPEEADEFEVEESEDVEPEDGGAEKQPAPIGAKTTLARKTTKAPPVPKIKSKTQFKAPSGGRSRTDVGVGEAVAFTSNIKGAWTVSGGTAVAPVTDGKKFRWLAADRAASITITLTAGTQTATTTMNVIEPTTITAKKLSEISFRKGQQGAGMKLRFIYQPLNVSFGNIEVKEVSGPPSNITGYYTSTPVGDLWHDSGDSFTRIGKDNKDTAIDTAQGAGDDPPWSDGTFDWVIPNHFKTIHESGDGKQFTTVTQAFKLEPSGRTIVSKGGQTVSRAP
jgi:hypothetical protein